MGLGRIVNDATLPTHSSLAFAISDGGGHAQLHSSVQKKKKRKNYFQCELSSAAVPSAALPPAAASNR